MASTTQLKRSSPEAEGIPASAVLDFIRAVEQHTHPLDAVQGFMLLSHGHVAAEGGWTPYGRTATWFRGTQVCHEGHIRAGGVEKDVTFVEEADSDIMVTPWGRTTSAWSRHATTSWCTALGQQLPLPQLDVAV